MELGKNKWIVGKFIHYYEFNLYWFIDCLYAVYTKHYL